MRWKFTRSKSLNSIPNLIEIDQERYKIIIAEVFASSHP